jgi:IMP dehydrogenase
MGTNTRKECDFRKKAFRNENLIVTFDDVICIPGYTNFPFDEVDLSTQLGPFRFYIPICSAAMDTVTEDQMAVSMALEGGLGVIHRNCSFDRQLEMVRKVKRTRSYIIEDVATVSPEMSIREVVDKMARMGISGFVVVDPHRKVIGIITRRDLPIDPNFEGKVQDVMTANPICLPSNVSRDEALQKLYEIRKEKIPLVDSKGVLTGLITRKDLRPFYSNSAKDNKGRLLCANACSPNLPKNTHDLASLKEIGKLTDIMMTDVAAFWKQIDIEGTKELMETLDCRFVVGNIGTYEAAEHLMTKANFPEDKFIGIKVGMGSGSICTTTIQTGVGAPTLFATAEVADAIKDYNPKLALIADGGFKYPGDLTKAFAFGADMIMSGHFFAGTMEAPGFVDNIEGRKVKVYRGMGSAEARAVGGYASDRYIKDSKKLTEGVSGYVPFVGSLKGVLEQLVEGLKNGFIYGGVKAVDESYKINIGRITTNGTTEAHPHDLQRLTRT